MTVSKKGFPDKRRNVLDFSYAKESSVNDGIPKDSYLNHNFYGPGCLLFKCDLSRAYRQIPVDPKDYHYLAFHWLDKIYFDTVIPFGLRSASMACQRTTNAVTYIYFNEFGYLCINYIDDFGGACSPDQVHHAFQTLISLLSEVGLVDSPEKGSLPATRMVFLGLLYDTVKMTVRVPEDKLLEIVSLVELWLSMNTARIKDLQSLLGKLSYVCACIRPGRIFMQRSSFFVLRSNYHQDSFQITSDFRSDLNWWFFFLSKFNGISLLPEPYWVTDANDFSADARDFGLGGFYCGCYYHIVLPNNFVSHHIITKELLAILLACILWKDKFTRKQLIISSDNETAMFELNHRSSKSEFRQQILRGIWYLSALHHFKIKVKHVPGKINRISDCLSRCHSGISFRQEFFRLASRRFSEITEFKYNMADFKFSSSW